MENNMPKNGLDEIKLHMKNFVIFLGILHLFMTLYELTGFSSIIHVRRVEYAVAAGTFFLLVIWICFSLKKQERKIEVIKRIKEYFSIEQVLLCIFFIITIISILVSISGQNSDWIYDNFRKAYDLLVCAFVIFPLGRYYAVHGIPTTVKRVLMVLLSVLTIVLFIMLLRIMQGDMYVEVHDGVEGIIGINSRYQLCLNVHSNTSGMYAAVITLLCIVGVLKSKKVLRILFSVLGIFYFIILTLSNSRASYLSFSIALSIVVAIVMYVSLEKRKALYRWTISILAMGITYVLLQFIRDGVYYIFDCITGYSSYMGSESGEVVRDLDPGNLMGRDVIWKCAVQAIVYDFKNIFIGVSPNGVVGMIASVTDIEWIKTMYTHNQFLEVAVAVGIPGLMVFVGWLVFIARDCVVIGFYDNKKVNLVSKIVPVVILCLIVNNLVEATLVWYSYFSGIVFFFLSGWVVGKYNELRK